MKILVIRFETRQDVYLLAGFLKRLRERYATAEIYLMTLEKNHDLVSTWDFLDDIIIFHPEKDIFRKWAFVSILRKINFDIVFDLQNNKTTKILNRFIRKKQKAVLAKDVSTHIVEDYFNVLKKYLPDVSINKHRQSFPAGFKYGIGKVRPPLLAIAPFSDEALPEWGIDRYLYIAGRFNEATGGDVVIVGNSEDEERARPFFVYDFIYNLPGKADFMQNLWVVSHSNIYLGGSSEYTQAAAEFEVPVIGIYEQKDMIKHYPVSEDAVVFSGCLLKRGEFSEICEVEEEKVIKAIIDILYKKNS